MRGQRVSGQQPAGISLNGGRPDELRSRTDLEDLLAVWASVLAELARGEQDRAQQAGTQLGCKAVVRQCKEREEGTVSSSSLSSDGRLPLDTQLGGDGLTLSCRS